MSRARNVADIMSGAGSNVVFEDGFGLDFGAVAGGGATGSVLDDYEEGTWTPTYGTDSGFSASALLNINCKYTKIGNVVHLYGTFNTNGSDNDLVAGDFLAVDNAPFSILDVSPFNSLVHTGSALLYDAFGGRINSSLLVAADTSQTRLVFRVVDPVGSPDADRQINFSVTHLTS